MNLGRNEMIRRKKCTHKSKHVRKVAPEWRLYSLSKAIKMKIINLIMDSRSIIAILMGTGKTMAIKNLCLSDHAIKIKRNCSI
jgi:hypothetical protein